MSGILNLLLAGAASVIKDAYFNLVTLLLNTTATNGAQNNTFLDSSTNNFTITRNGNTTQGTFTPFSQTGWGNFFSSSANYLTVPYNANFVFNTGARTYEAWVYVTSVAANNAIFALSDLSSSNQFELYINTSSQVAFRYFTTTPQITTTTGTVPLNTWTHVAFVYDGTSNFTIYINGVSSATGTKAGTPVTPTPQLCIGRTNIGSAGDVFFSGYISNARFTTTTVYTSNFTPSTTPLTAITGTTLLTCQSNRFVDNSASPATVTANGSVSVQAFSPFLPTIEYDAAVVGGSGYFDGTGDYLTFTDSANNLDLGGLVASFEAWVYPTSAVAGQHFAYKHGGALSWSASNGIEYAIAFDVNKFYLVYNNASSPAFINGAATRQPYQWHHVVVATDASNNIALFVNGVREGTATNAITKPTTRTTITIGANVSGAELIFGYVSGQRFIKGSGAYDPTQSTITVPTAPPTAVTNTQLLINYTNAGIFDSAAKNVLETVGSAQVSTTTAKWGTTSMKFNGSTDRLTIRQSDFFDFGTGDFTIELWVNFNSVSTVQALATNYLNSTTGWGLQWRSDTGAWNFGYGDTGLISYTNTPSTGTWIHVAVARSGTSLKMFINGTQVASATNSTSMSGTTTNLTLGVNPFAGGVQYFDGYMDDFRITKGYARYTATFTAPTAAFPLL